MPGEPQKLRVFLAEDNLGDVYLIKEALRANNYAFEIDRSEDGESSLGKLSRFVAGDVPDLIIIDLNMPKIDGLDLLRYVRSSQLLATVPVMILTSSCSPQDRLEAERLGANAFITKPPTLNEFLSAIGSGIRSAVSPAARPSSAV
jgi:CheY-like chemotaxis protein